MGTKDYLSHKIRAFLKKHSTMVQVFGPLPSLLAFRLTELPRNREGYKKVKLQIREDNKNSCYNIYPCTREAP